MATANSMPRRRAPWWMYVIAATYVLTFFFNARQEACGPEIIGLTPSWPTLKVARVLPGGLMDKAGLQVGDVLEAADGYSLTRMPDWFLARAHFERNRPLEIQIRRGEEHLRLNTVITQPGFRTWNRAYTLVELALCLARFMMLFSAIFVAFSRPQQLTARLAAMMLAVGAVAEGYPIPGWAAALRHLPAVLAMPICLASISCLLASMIWLPFCATFSGGRLWQRRQWILVLLPVGFFGLSMIASAVAMIYSPSSLARPWPLVFSAGPVRVIEDLAGDAPLLFLNVWPFYGPVMHARLLELWLVVSVLYFSAGFLILAARYWRLDDPQQKRRMGALCIALVLFGFIFLHNSFTRNWPRWFGSPPPSVLFSSVTFAAEAILFLIVPVTLAWGVLATSRDGDQEAQSTMANTAVR